MCNLILSTFPEGASVGKATLRLYVNSVLKPGTPFAAHAKTANIVKPMIIPKEANP